MAHLTFLVILELFLKSGFIKTYFFELYFLLYSCPLSINQMCSPWRIMLISNALPSFKHSKRKAIQKRETESEDTVVSAHVPKLSIQ